MNLQFIGFLLVSIVVFFLIGNLARMDMAGEQETRELYVLDLDGSGIAGELFGRPLAPGFQLKPLEAADRESALEFAENSGMASFIVIPEGFGSRLSNFQFKEIETYSILRSFSLRDVTEAELISRFINDLNTHATELLLRDRVPDIPPERAMNPISSKDTIIVRGRRAEGSVADVSGFVYSQSIFIPIILFIIIILSSQTVMSAIAMEKQDKTLETLLTVPIKRTHIVMAKMLAAGLVGLSGAAIYLVGLRTYVGKLIGQGPGIDQVSGVVRELNLFFTAGDYFLLGISLFLAILCALAMAIILGVLIDDIKNIQGAMIPLIMMVLIPYLLSFFADVQSLSWPARLLLLAIPFSHPFFATQNLLLSNYSFVLYGILYMLVVFSVLITAAGKIFSTDRIVTMKLRFGKPMRSQKSH